MEQNNIKPEVIGGAIGVIFMALFGMLWTFTGTMGLAGWGAPFVFICGLIIGLMVFVGGILLLIKSKGLPNHNAEENLLHGKRLGRSFNRVFIVQGLAIGGSIAILNITNRQDLIPPVIAVIVGLHFFH